MPARPKPKRPKLVPLPTGDWNARHASVALPPVRTPRAPGWLPDDAAAVWRTTARAMIDAGTWHPIFSDTLASYVVLEARFRRELDNFPVTAMVQKRLLAADLGLNPSTYGRVQTVTARRKK